MARRGRNTGWVPNYHGAWAMVALPPIIGIILGGFTPAHLLLLITWWVGFFAFFATTTWVKSRRKPKFRKPVVVYSSITLVAGAILLAWYPGLFVWAPAFLPLMAIAAWETWHRRDRSELSNVVTILAGGLLTPVAFHLSLLAGHEPAGRHGLDAWPWVWLATVSITGYFIGTAWYVKTNIRRREDRPFLVFSTAYHVVFAIFFTYATIQGWMSIFHAIVWWLLAARTWAVADYGHRKNIRIKPRLIGIGEIVTTVLIIIGLFL
ncbi:MAG: YwiC-like family protein [Flaviflexus sp.]|nr:YwiC-like family protein [Flaviflexus sp.]